MSRRRERSSDAPIIRFRRDECTRGRRPRPSAPNYNERPSKNHAQGSQGNNWRRSPGDIVPAKSRHSEVLFNTGVGPTAFLRSKVVNGPSEPSVSLVNGTARHESTLRDQLFPESFRESVRCWARRTTTVVGISANSCLPEHENLGWSKTSNVPMTRKAHVFNSQEDDDAKNPYYTSSRRSSASAGSSFRRSP